MIILITHLCPQCHLHFSIIFHSYCFVDSGYNFLWNLLPSESPTQLCTHMDWEYTGAEMEIPLDFGEVQKHIPGIGFLCINSSARRQLYSAAKTPLQQILLNLRYQICNQHKTLPSLDATNGTFSSFAQQLDELFLCWNTTSVSQH